MDNIVSAALNDAGCRNKGELRLFLKLGNSKGSAVAHGGLNLCKGEVYIVLKTACIGHIGVNALLKGKLLIAA